MIEGHINLYSDTQSRPTQGMREAMLNAPVGDEQKSLDPSVNQLCEYVADLVGMEAALFLPSGTMCNEIAILVHCRPGDEVYTDKSAHIIHFEAGGPGALAGVSIAPLDGINGVFDVADLEDAIRPPSRYAPKPRLLSIEQTSNLGGGTIWPLEIVHSLVSCAKENGLSSHMDGARLMNAVVASGISAKSYCKGFDSVWIDLSKGLGCPFGAVLAGSQAFVDEAWRWKQRLGGAMRQAGMMAAAGLYALENHLEMIAQDHINARKLATIFAGHPSGNIYVDVDNVQTNIVFIDTKMTGHTAQEISLKLEEKGVNIGPFSPYQLRAVTHLNVSSAQIEEAGKIFYEVIDSLSVS